MGKFLIFWDKRDLLTQMDYKRGNTLVSQRVYTYDALGRPLTRQTSRNGQTVNDSFVHTYRSELANAQVNGQTYAYDYDNIGNRRMSIDASDYAFYDANELNQYSSIRKNEDPAFVPTFDAAGNQTLVRTATGTWSVSYNAENRPVIFQKTTDSVTTRITCSYDYMGRRATKKVEEISTDAEGNETTTVISNHRFIYRGYLQIACCDLSRSGHPCLWLITWDPTQPVATRPLAIQKDGTWFCYGWDLTKNICEIFGQNGYIRSTYAYTPFGAVSASGDVEQPIQWSSEYSDNELALVYYNYRHYNPTDGRWINRDPIAEQGGWNLYAFVGNRIWLIDKIGLDRFGEKIFSRYVWYIDLFLLTRGGSILFENEKMYGEMKEVNNMEAFFKYEIKEIIKEELYKIKKYPTIIEFDLYQIYRNKNWTSYSRPGLYKPLFDTRLVDSRFWLGNPQKIMASGKFKICFNKDNVKLLEVKNVYFKWVDRIDSRACKSDGDIQYRLEQIHGIIIDPIISFDVEIIGILNKEHIQYAIDNLYNNRGQFK